jgi:hypothetical protein
MGAVTSTWTGLRPTSAQVLYLDQWCWDDLVQENEARMTGGLLDSLREAVRDGRVAIPLFQSHLQENWHRRGAARRQRVASVMGELSGLLTVYPKPLDAWECDIAVANHFGLDVAIEPPDVFGTGVEHLITGKEQRRPLEVEYAILGKASPYMPVLEEGASLHGTIAAEFTHEQQRVQAAISGYHRTPDVVHTSVLLTAFVAAFEGLAAAAGRLGLDWFAEVARLSDLPVDERISAMETILDAMPVHSTYTRLRHHAHLNSQFAWNPSDGMDFRAVAEALPVVDVLVADKKCVDLIDKAGVAGRHGVTVTKRLGDLPDILGLAN